eukprot:Em0022g330a
MSAQLIGGRHEEGSTSFHIEDEYSDCESRNGPRPRVIVSPTKPESLSKASSEATHSSWSNTNHSVENETIDQVARRKGANGITGNHFVVAKRNSKATVCILPEEKPLRIGEPPFPNNTFASSKPSSATVSGKLLSKTLPVRTMSCVFDAPAASKKKNGPLSIFGAFRRGSADSDNIRLTPAQPIVPLGVLGNPASPILLGRSRSVTLPSKQPAPVESQGARQQQHQQQQHQGTTANGESRHAQCENGFLPPPAENLRVRKVVDTRLPQRSTRLAKLETVPGSPAPYIPNGASSCTMPNPQRETEHDIVPATQTNLRTRRLRNSSSAGPSSRETLVAHEAAPRDPECADLPPVPAYVPPGWTEEPPKVKPRHPVRKGHTFTEGASHQPADWREMRQHVARFLLETEQSYVQSLRTIVKVYFESLKSSSLIEGSLLKDIFSHIPEICAIHEKFLQEVSERIEKWHHMQKIGDILINTFSKCQLMELYSAFIQNFMRAKAAVEAVVKLPSQQTVHSVVAMGHCVCVSVQELPLVHLYHMPSNVLLLTVDITNSVSDLLKGYENILLQQRSTCLKVTSLCPFEHLLMVGTSAGVIVGLPIPHLGPDPQPLPYLTQVLPLLQGHVGRVQVMTSLKREGVPILVSGGCGCEDMMHSSVVKDFPETASCLLLWKPSTP